MNAALPTSCRATLEVIRNATSSPASADGPTRCALPAGPTIDLAGPAPVRVSRFRAQDSTKAMPINAISGPLFNVSSPSADLQRCLANRLRARMDVNGSPEYALTWKDWDMAAGPQICALRGSARRISGSDCIGWPTPTICGDHNRKGASASSGDGLATVANKLLGWATPQAADWQNGQTKNPKSNSGHNVPAQTMRIIWNGTAPLSSLSARMDRGAYRLNPKFSLWLMGFPTEWESCAEPGTPSSRRSRRSL